MSLKAAVFGTVALAAALLAGRSAFPAEPASVWLDRAVPPFSVPNVEGQEVSLARLLDGSKAVVMSFWGVRCGACIDEMPHLGALADKLGTRGLRVVGVNTDGIKPEDIGEYLSALPYRPTYTLLCDPEFKVMDAYKVTAVPYTVVIRPDGKAAFEHLGFAAGDEKALEQAVLKLVGTPGP